jgi:hypothetical protein
VINCIGVVKQLAGADDPSIAIPIFAVLPLRLAILRHNHGTRRMKTSGFDAKASQADWVCQPSPGHRIHENSASFEVMPQQRANAIGDVVKRYLAGQFDSVDAGQSTSWQRTRSTARAIGQKVLA